MRHRLVVALGAVVAALAITGSAMAFDCMRVSSSLQGLRASTTSGSWLLFDMTPAGTGVVDILSFFAEDPTSPPGLDPSNATQVACFQAAYSASSAPKYFALGIGVAGGRTGHGPEVLAHRAPDKVLMNGTGIEHFDDTVVPVFVSALPTCLGP
jgi:hypothetical protein